MPAQITGPQFATREGKKPIQRIYRISVGDKLKVSVFGEENLSGEFEVSALGNISMPLIGEMPAKGLAIHEFRDSITRKLSDGYLKNPKINVDILNYRPIFVHGEVKTGGEFAYKNGLGLRDAIAGTAGAAPASTYTPTRGQPGKDVIWIPTPDRLVTRMLQLAQVTPAD